MDLNDPHARASARYGWTFLAVFMLGGLMLESLHGIKAPWYLDNHLRRELWVLGHAHGALLAVVNLVFAAYAVALLPDARKRRLASLTLRSGALLVPAGFFLGGVGNSESDPSLFILTTPVGALLVLHAVATMALAAWRRPVPTPAAQAPPGRKLR
jgi:hypothetical protein